ncbi:MAG: hypothetical protein KF686_20160 [Ramlibacter sp.]|nr:hypothetical protein [Ramlibacter sp.]
MIHSVETPQSPRVLQVHPYAQLRAAQAQVEMAALAQTYANQVAALDVELNAIRPQLLNFAARWAEASRYARELSVGTDVEPLTPAVKRALFGSLLAFELFVGSLAMRALTAF